MMALDNPGYRIPFVHRTLTSGSFNAGWNTFRQLNIDYDLGLEFVKNPLHLVVFPGGGEVWFVGADKEDQVEKLRGDSYPGACVDESGTYRLSLLSKLIDDVLSPALVQHGGSLTLVGTPGYVSKGLFYEACTDHQLEAGVHHWTMLDNPHLPDPKGEMEKVLKRRMWEEDNPIFRREWLGHWVFNKGGLVYRGFDSVRNRCGADLPNGAEPKRWSYVLGIDYGFSPAPTAFTIAAYDNKQPRVHVLMNYEKAHLIHSKVAVEVLKLQAKLQIEFEAVIVDAAHPELIAALHQQGIAAEKASKTDKMGYIELLNNDFVTGIVQVDIDKCKPLVEQLRTLPLSDKTDENKLIEDKSYANHSTDSLLYLWRHCNEFYGEMEKVAIGPSFTEADEIAMFQPIEEQEWWSKDPVDDYHQGGAWWESEPY